MGQTFVFVLVWLDRKEQRVVATVKPIMGLGGGKAEEFMGSELALKLLRFLNQNHVLPGFVSVTTARYSPTQMWKATPKIWIWTTTTRSWRWTAAEITLSPS